MTVLCLDKRRQAVNNLLDHLQKLGDNVHPSLIEKIKHDSFNRLSRFYRFTLMSNVTVGSNLQQQIESDGPLSDDWFIGTRQVFFRRMQMLRPDRQQAA